MSTPPPTRAPPSRAPEPAVRMKRAPIPPKRTSSFNQQLRDNSKLSLLPEPLLETETDFSSTAVGNYDADITNLESSITGVVESIEKEFSFLNDVAVTMNDIDDTPEQQKSRSSSSELLSSTPGTQSHSGSLERILQRRLMNTANTRERSPPGGVHALNSSGGEVAKTPDTDVSELSASSPAVPPGVSAAVQTSLHELPESLPLSHLRDNLRKSQTYPRTETTSASAALMASGVNTSVASLDTSNIEQVISRYGTMPKTARIGAYLASLEQLPKGGTTKQNGESPAVVDVSAATQQMPTPDIRRKVEEWRAGVEKSMEAEDTSSLLTHQVAPSTRCAAWTKNASDIEHNGSQSPLFRSSSIHALSRTEFTAGSGRAPISTHLLRGKSDLSDSRFRSGSDHELCRNPNPLTQDTTPRPVEWTNFRPKPAPRNLPQQQGVRHSPPVTIETSGRGETKQTEDLGLKLTDHSLQHQSSSSDEALLDQKSIKSGDSGIKCDERGFLTRKFSPLVPKKPIVSSSTPLPPQILHEEMTPRVQSPTFSMRSLRRDNTVERKTRQTDASVDTNTDSVLESSKKDTTTFERLSSRKHANVELQMLLQPAPPKSSKPNVSPTATTSCGMFETVKSKFGFLRQRSTEGVKGAPGVSSPAGTPVDALKEKEETIALRSSVTGKPAPHGARSVLPGSKLFLPGSQANVALVSPQQLPSRTCLHHVNITNKAAEKPDEVSEPVSKDAIVTLCEKLSRRLEALTSTSNKHTSVFLQLTDEVQEFYVACHSYVESLAPHAKFQFREMLVTLQTITERLKTCTAKDYDRLTADLLRSLQDIKQTLKR